MDKNKEMSNDDTKIRVFISHSSKDFAFIEHELLPLLDENKIGYWYSKQDIRSASDWERSIVKGLESCNWFIVVLSKNSAASDWVRDEVHWAIDNLEGKIIPIALDATPLEQLHIRLVRVQHIDFMDSSKYREGKSKLLSTLNMMVDGVNDFVPTLDNGLQEINKIFAELDSNPETFDGLKLRKIAETAIKYGAPLYNNGSVIDCVKIYQDTINKTASFIASVPENPDLTPVLNLLHQQFDARLSIDLSELQSVETLKVAWDLRKILDTFKRIAEVGTAINTLRSSLQPRSSETGLQYITQKLQHCIYEALGLSEDLTEKQYEAGALQVLLWTCRFLMSLKEDNILTDNLRKEFTIMLITDSLDDLENNDDDLLQNFEYRLQRLGDQLNMVS